MLDPTASAPAAVTEVSTYGFGDRLAGSFVGVLVGFVLFLLSFVVLWWNEGNVIAERGALDEMRRSLVRASADAPTAATNAKVVHAVGKLTSPERIGDAPYVKPGAYLALERKVEMYQWIEKSDTRTTRSGNTTRRETTYSYAKGWAEGRGDSSRFKEPQGHDNPPLAIQPRAAQVKASTFGKYDGKAVLEHVPGHESLQVTPAMLVPAAAGKPKPELRNGLIYLRRTPGGSGGDQLGDVRLVYTAVKQGTFSVIARQDSPKKLAVHTSRNGKQKFLVARGKQPPTAMIQAEKDAANGFAMLLRVGGFFMMFIGMNLLAGPITTLLSALPLIGTAGRFVLGVVFFVASLVLTGITIAVSMIAHSPILLALVVVLAGAAGFYWYKTKQQRAAAGAGGGAAPGTEDAVGAGGFSAAPGRRKAA